MWIAYLSSSFVFPPDGRFAIIRAGCMLVYSPLDVEIWPTDLMLSRPESVSFLFLGGGTEGGPG